MQISKQSRVYRYYSYLNNALGLGLPTDQTNLCKFFWSILGMTLLYVFVRLIALFLSCLVVLGTFVTPFFGYRVAFSRERYEEFKTDNFYIPYLDAVNGLFLFTELKEIKWLHWKLFSIEFMPFSVIILGVIIWFFLYGLGMVGNMYIYQGVEVNPVVSGISALLLLSVFSVVLVVFVFCCLFFGWKMAVRIAKGLIKAIKENACPLVTFVNEEEVSDTK